MVGTLSRRYKTGRETLPEIWNWSGHTFGGLELVGRPSGSPEVVGRPSRRSGTGRDSLPDGPNLWADPPGVPEMVGRPSRRS